MEESLRIGFSSGHVFCAGDVKKVFSEPRLFENDLDFVAERAGGDRQWVGRGGFAHEFAYTGENDRMVLHRFHIGEGFSLHQLCNSSRVRGTLMRSEGFDEATSI